MGSYLILPTIPIAIAEVVVPKMVYHYGSLRKTIQLLKKLGKTYDQSGNKNLEICFETDDYEKVIAKLKKHDLKYLHETIEERWGQKMIRFYAPENNLVEIGETSPCFVKRFYNQGMTVEKVPERTSVPIELVKKYVMTKK